MTVRENKIAEIRTELDLVKNAHPDHILQASREFHAHARDYVDFLLSELERKDEELASVRRVAESAAGRRNEEIHRLLLALAKIQDEMTDDTSERAQRINRIVIEYLSGTTESSEQPNSAHVREEVQWFAQQMENALRENDHRGGWDLEPFGYFCTKIHETVHKLTSQRFENNPDWDLVIKKAVDLANYSMMAADNVRKILPVKGDNHD